LFTSLHYAHWAELVVLALGSIAWLSDLKLIWVAQLKNLVLVVLALGSIAWLSLSLSLSPSGWIKSLG